MGRRSNWASFRGLTSGVLALALVLPGCSTGNFTVSADDACGAERQQLKQIQDDIIGAAVGGALLGAVTGGLAGGLIGGNTKGALIGAGAGAVVGGLGGYLLAKRNATSDPATLHSSIYKDVATDNERIDRTTGLFRQLRACRFRSADAVKANYAAGKIARPQAQEQLARIRTLFQEDIAYAEQIGAKMNEQGNSYQFASDELVKNDPQAQRQLAARPRPAAPSPRAPSNPNAWTAKEAARIRDKPGTDGAQIGNLTRGEAVTVVAGDGVPGDWQQIKLADGRTGFVAKRLLNSPGSAVAAAAAAPAAAARAPTAPPESVVGVAEVTESNQVKRKALNDEVEQSKVAAAAAFDLDGKISRLPIPSAAATAG